MAKHPDDIWLEVGTERFKVRGDSLEGAGARWRRWPASRRSLLATANTKKTDREIPIVRLTRP